MEHEINFRELRRLVVHCPFLLSGEIAEGDLAMCKLADAKYEDLEDYVDFGKVI